VEIDPQTKTCFSGFGSINFNSRDKLVAGLKVINGLAIDGSKLSVRPTCSTDLNSKTTIFIRNLTDQTSINDLLPLVSQFGLVLSAYMPVDPILKRSKGIAYVDFDTPEAASSAIEQLNNKPSPKGNSQMMVLPYHQ
jgi:hypothetical protein